MVGPALPDELIVDLLVRLALNQLLQFGLVVLGAVGLADLRVLEDLFQDKAPRLAQAAVQIECTEEGLEEIA